MIRYRYESFGVGEGVDCKILGFIEILGRSL
jgi:hypothetical protein